MKTQIRLVAAALTVVALAALPAGARATGAGTDISKSPFSITATSPFPTCYDRLSTNIPVSLTGGTPGDYFTVELRRNGRVIQSQSGDDPFDANGNGEVTLFDIDGGFSNDFPIAGLPVSADVLDYPQVVNGAPNESTIGNFLLSQLAINVDVEPANASLKRNVVFSGEFPNRVDYGFITNRAGTRVLRKWRLGRSNACGYVKAKEVVSPPGAPSGAYRLYIYPGTHLVERSAYKYTFTITRDS